MACHRTRKKRVVRHHSTSSRHKRAKSKRNVRKAKKKCP